MVYWMARKFVFLARLADQPRAYAYQLGKRCWERIAEKSGVSLQRYLEFLAVRRGKLFLREEWRASDADVRFLRREIPDRQELLERVCFQMYRRQKPIDYVLGWTPFMGLRIQTRSPVLIPRSDTAIWVGALIRLLQEEEKGAHSLPLRVLEVGTGTGCVTIALAQALPSNHYTAIDVSGRAVQLARVNVRASGASNARILCHDVYDPRLLACLGPFDMIVCNPPYVAARDKSTQVAPSVKRWESHLALIGGSDVYGASFQRRLLELARQLEGRPGVPRLAMELNGTAAQAQHVHRLSRELGFSNVELIDDPASGRPRALFLS